jgi:hypothetical protein
MQNGRVRLPRLTEIKGFFWQNPEPLNRAMERIRRCAGNGGPHDFRAHPTTRGRSRPASASSEAAERLAPEYGQGYANLDEVRSEVVAGYDVSVEVKYHLSSTAIDIDEETIPGIGNAEVLRNLPGNLGHMSNQTIAFRDIIQRGQVSPRHDQYVYGRRWIGVPESDNGVVLIDFFCGPLTVNDIAKDAGGYGIGHGVRLVSRGLLMHFSDGDGEIAF